MSRHVSLLFLLHVLTCVYSLTIRVEPRSEQCFYESIDREHTIVMVQYQVSSGGFLDIDVYAKNTKEEVIHRVQRETEGKFSFSAGEKGTYQICFSNEFSSLTPKTIMFNVHVSDILDPHLAKINEKDKVVLSIQRIHDGLQSVLEEQHFYKAREASHRDLVEEMNTKVVLWSLIETLVLLVLAIWQVFYLRHFFNVKR
jgi:hypothetical protein